MTIKIEDLAELLSKAKGESAKEPIYISFGDKVAKVPRSTEFEAIDSSMLVLDLDDDGHVIGIEIV